MLLALILQTGVSEPGAGLISLGVGGGIAALVITLWRQDRKESQERYSSLAKESNERAAAIANEFRIIVQDNTRAITALTAKLESGFAV